MVTFRGKDCWTGEVKVIKTKFFKSSESLNAISMEDFDRVRKDLRNVLRSMTENTLEGVSIIAVLEEVFSVLSLVEREVLKEPVNG